MDDCTFDKKTALHWINSIESKEATIRDKDIYPKLNSWISEGKMDKVLEIGCGQGICSDKIILYNKKYIGIEPSITMIERAQQLYSNQSRYFKVGNIYSLPFSNSTFDSCFSVAVWHLLKDIYISAEELSRVLIPHGRFLIITANPEAYKIWKNLYDDYTIEGKRLDGFITMKDGTKSHDILYLHTIEDLMDSLFKAGLNIEKTDTFRQQENLNLFIAIQGYKK